MQRFISILIAVGLVGFFLFWVTDSEDGKPDQVKVSSEDEGVKEVAEEVTDLEGDEALEEPSRLKALFVPDERTLLQRVNQETTQLATKVKPSIVSVRIKRRKVSVTSQPFMEGILERADPNQPYSGSGVVISEEGHVVTNYHVIAGGEGVEVVLADGMVKRAEVVGVDIQTDLAVLKVDAETVPAVWGDSDKVKVGEMVFSSGNPFDLERSFTMGVISGMGRTGLFEDGEIYEDFLQIDDAISPGNSGGGCFNWEGKLVGVYTAAVAPSNSPAGIGFAIPSYLVRFVVNSILDHGYVVRGYLGVRVQDADEEMVRSFSYGGNRGVLVSDVISGSPAEAAGILAGDFIEGIGEESIDSTMQMRVFISQLPEGKNEVVKVWRQGGLHEIPVIIGSLHAGASEIALVESLNLRGDETERSGWGAGIQVENLSEVFREKYGIPEELSGVVVSRVDAYSAEAEAGIRVGSVIMEAAGQKVGDIKGFRSVLGAEGQSPSVLLYVWGGGVKRYYLLK